MVIDIINVEHIGVSEAENHSPVGANGHGPKPFQLSLERMQPKGRVALASERVASDAANR